MFKGFKVPLSLSKGLRLSDLKVTLRFSPDDYILSDMLSSQDKDLQKFLTAFLSKSEFSHEFSVEVNKGNITVVVINPHTNDSLNECQVKDLAKYIFNDLISSFYLKHIFFESCHVEVSAIDIHGKPYAYATHYQSMM